MTVCIAGTYENGKGAIIVTDKQRGFDHPLLKESLSVENEDIVKHKKLTDLVTITFSGNMEFAFPYIEELEKSIRPDDKVSKIIKKVEVIFRKHRLANIAYKILHTYGFETMAEYNSANIAHEQRRQINYKIDNFYTPIDLILVANDNGVYSVYTLNDPGKLERNDYGYSAIGSGSPYATKIVAKNYIKEIDKDNLKKVLLEAKKSAEQDKDVGEQTDIIELKGL